MLLLGGGVLACIYIILTRTQKILLFIRNRDIRHQFIVFLAFKKKSQATKTQSSITEMTFPTADQCSAVFQHLQLLRASAAAVVCMCKVSYHMLIVY